jgi:MOSC domain-containing protein YiiM
VYVYPAEHYDFWRRELPEAALPWGAFGENFTTDGLREDDVWIGDRYRVGTTELVVTQPRMPCYKLGIRFDRPDMVKRFLQSRRSGFYLAVEREGEVGAGDVIERLARDDTRLTVADVVALYAADSANQPLLARASDHPSLPGAWREYFRKRLWEPDA